MEQIHPRILWTSKWSSTPREGPLEQRALFEVKTKKFYKKDMLWNAAKTEEMIVPILTVWYQIGSGYMWKTIPSKFMEIQGRTSLFDKEPRSQSKSYCWVLLQ